MECRMPDMRCIVSSKAGVLLAKISMTDKPEGSLMRVRRKPLAAADACLNSSLQTQLQGSVATSVLKYSVHSNTDVSSRHLRRAKKNTSINDHYFCVAMEMLLKSHRTYQKGNKY